MYRTSIQQYILTKYPNTMKKFISFIYHAMIFFALIAAAVYTLVQGAYPVSAAFFAVTVLFVLVTLDRIKIEKLI